VRCDDAVDPTQHFFFFAKPSFRQNLLGGIQTRKGYTHHVYGSVVGRGSFEEKPLASHALEGTTKSLSYLTSELPQFYLKVGCVQPGVRMSCHNIHKIVQHFGRNFTLHVPAFAQNSEQLRSKEGPSFTTFIDKWF